MGQFSDNFDAGGGNFTDLWNTCDYEASQAASGSPSGSAARYNTACDGVIQYAKVQLVESTPAGGLVLRATTSSTNPWYHVFVYTDLVAYIAVYTTSEQWALQIDDTISWAQNDYLGVTITGTGTGTVVRIWQNPTGDAPTAVDNWGGPPDASLSASGGWASYADTGVYVGWGYQSGAFNHDNWSGGDVPAGGATPIEKQLSESLIYG